MNSKDEKTVNPLWLPKGSVRAILTLCVALTTLYMLVFAHDQLPQSLGNVLIVSVAFYYSTRAAIITTPPKGQLEKANKDEPAPLFLPTSTVRITLAIIIILSIVVTIISNQQIPIFMLTVLLTIIGYVLGMFVKEIIVKIFPPKPGRNLAKEIIGHLQAGIILAIVIGVCCTNIISTFSIIMFDSNTSIFLNQVLELTIGYYFGSRTLR